MTTKCVASHYAHDCSDPEQCRTWLAVLLANSERREQRAELDRADQAEAEVAEFLRRRDADRQVA